MTFATDGLAYGVPEHGQRVLDVLERAGFEAWVVGGWVRDALRGAPSHDVDVTTSAHWEQTARTLRAAGIEVHETGIAHGTVTAVVSGEPVEVTTFRTEGVYSDHRHPDDVRFVTDVREDLRRRDFTVNAMAYHPERGLLDLFGGADDLNRRVIRAVGVPSERFEEDALRVLRAVRFAARMGFVVERATHEALIAAAPDLAHIASERIGQELDGIVRSGHAAWALEAEPEVMCAAIPELAAMRGFDQQSPWHIYDVYEHTVHVCRACEEFTVGMATDELRWAALLHDVAKPVTFEADENGRGHFFGHPKVGAQMCSTIMRRLALPKTYVQRASTLIRLHDHMVYPTPRSIRRSLLKLERACPGDARSLIFQLIDLKRSDAVSKVPSAAHYAVELDALSAAVRRELSAQPPLRVSELAVSGADLIEEANLTPGPELGQVLDELLRCVVNGELPNRRDDLIEKARSLA